MSVREKMIRTLAPRMDFMDAGTAMLRTLQSVGRHNLPRNAREMNFAAQDYMTENKKTATVEGLVDAMISAPRRPEWPA